MMADSGFGNWGGNGFDPRRVQASSGSAGREVYLPAATRERLAGGQRSAWNGAAGLRAERGRWRRNLRAAALVSALFLYGLLQVRLGSEAASRSSRVNTLRAEIRKTEVDLTVGKSRLESRRILGTLLPAAEQSGFGPGGLHRTIAVDVTPTPEADPLITQVGQELRAGAEALLPQALAQEVHAAGKSRAHRR